MVGVSEQGKKLIAIMVVFTLLTSVSMFLRFYVMLFVRRRSLRADDYLIILSFASLLTVEATMFWAVHYSLGAHYADASWEDMAVQLKMTTSNLFSWTFGTCACKLAVLFLYLDIFRTDVWFKRVTWALIVCTSAYPFVFIPYFMTRCHPVSAAWDMKLSVTNCRDLTEQELASVAVQLFLDAAIVISPMPVVWNLKMPTSKKLGVTAMISLGAAVVGIMIWRLYTTSNPPVPADPLYDLYTTAIQGQMEIWLGILAANLPTLGPLLGKLPGKIRTHYGSSNTGGGYGNWKDGNTLQTFSSSVKAHKSPTRSEFQLLDEELDRAMPFEQGIIRNQEFHVVSEPRPSVPGVAV